MGITPDCGSEGGFRVVGFDGEGAAFDFQTGKRPDGKGRSLLHCRGRAFEAEDDEIRHVSGSLLGEWRRFLGAFPS